MANITTKIVCPQCKGSNITSCPGGTCYKSSQWAIEHIKYICTDCLCEFGDDGLIIQAEGTDNQIPF